MTQPQHNVVVIHYTVTDAQGNELDSSAGGEPLVVLLGRGALISGLEQALHGKVAGDTFTTTIEPADAYGERHDELVQSVPKSMFDNMDVSPGMRFRASGHDGQQRSVIVLDVTDEEVVVDGNHPLSGIALTFSVEVVLTREASADELAHGHAHGADGHSCH